VVLKTVTFGVSPVAISLFYPEFSPMLHGVPVAKDLLMKNTPRMNWLFGNMEWYLYSCFAQ
jgi:hypothetical protein